MIDINDYPWRLSSMREMELKRELMEVNMQPRYFTTSTYFTDLDIKEEKKENNKKSNMLLLLL